MERKQGNRCLRICLHCSRLGFFLIRRNLEIPGIFQINDIKRRFDDKAKQQIEFQNLLDEEVRILNEIEKKRNKIRKQAHEKFMDEMLDKMGAPVKWIGYKSMITFEY